MKPIIFGIAASAMLISGACLAQTSTSNAGAATGNTNQAIATTAGNASIPAKGANSFTMAEARSRIADQGFSNVSDLTKDDSGVWHGKAEKAGTPTTVWLDYKGNVGEAH